MERASKPSFATVSRFISLLVRSASRVNRTSAALSSMRRISIARTKVGSFAIANLPLDGNGKEKSGASAKLGLHPDAAAVAFHDFFSNRQANAGAGILGSRMQPLKDIEDLVVKLRVNADAVVPDGETPYAGHPFGRYMHERRFAAMELESIADEV